MAASVPPIAASDLEAHVTKRQIHIVVDHADFVRQDLEKRRNGDGGLAAQVHVRLRLGEDDGVASVLSGFEGILFTRSL